jgi:hypothetical protein
VPLLPTFSSCCAEISVWLLSMLIYWRDSSYSLLKHVETEAQNWFPASEEGTRISWDQLNWSLPPFPPWSLVYPMSDFHYQHDSHLPGLWMCLQCTICLLGDPVANRGRKKIGTRRTFYGSFLMVTAKGVYPGSWNTGTVVLTALSHCLWTILG